MTSDEFLQVCAPVAHLVGKKGEDYNRGQVKLSDYFPFGHISHAHMVHLKSMRLISLVSNLGKQPNFDSIEDTLQDILAYTVFYLEALKSGKLGK